MDDFSLDARLPHSAFITGHRYTGFRYPSVLKCRTRYPFKDARYSLGYYRGRKRVVFDYFRSREVAIRYYDALKERYPWLVFDILPILF